MSLTLFNTLSRKKEVFDPLEGKKVGLYTCGPTVYDYPHIGNLRTFTFEDILKRTLLYLGYEVEHVMNITDVGELVSDEDSDEDKMEKGARRENKTVWEIAEYYTHCFFQDIEKMNILKADIYSKATDHIQEQIELIRKLEEKGFTYTIQDGVYFDSKKLSDYGKLAQLDIEGLEAGARVEMVEGKKRPTDFALWKFSKPEQKRQMEWDSPWGKGFPGWHIECSAMSMKYLGETFDIHCGGIDHIPVHHTNEIAQSEAASGKLFVKYWVHLNFLLVEGQKMSKSLGNFYTLTTLIEKGYSPRTIRYLYISSHYRQQQNFTFQALEQAKNTLEGIDRFMGNLRELQKDMRNEYSESNSSLNLLQVKEKIIESLEDDLNTPQAFGHIFEMMKEVNKALQENTLTSQDAEQVLDLLHDIDKILGVLVVDLEENIPPEIQSLLDKRQQARESKDFQESDRLRDLIEKAGYNILDTKAGQKIEKK